MQIFSMSKIISLIIAIIMMVPLLLIFSSFLSIDWNIWAHLTTYLLPELTLNTLKLLLGVSVGTLLIALPLAYINAFYEYPGRRFFSFIALMPMSIPAYIMAFVYVALFDVTGMWSMKLRALLGLEGFLPGIRNVYGISLVLSLCFYPYIYLMTKNAFQNQGARAIEAARMMGVSTSKIIFKVILPLSLPWILSGLLLVMMETLGDFGAVSIFNFTTFTTAIYRSWFGLFSLSSAQQLASILMTFVFLLLILERWITGKKRYTHVGKGAAHISRSKLSNGNSLLVIVLSLMVSGMAFFIPLFMIVKWAISVMARDLDQRYFSLVLGSLQAATLTTVVLIFCTMFMAYAVRKYPGVIATMIKSASSLGYAVPGTVMAVAVYLFLATIENTMNNTMSISSKLLTSGSMAMIIGLSIRFFSLALSPLSTSFLRIKDAHFNVLELTGNSRIRNFTKAILPMIRPGMMTAALLVFVEVMKEMPITLMTRPFGKETLSVRIFEMTSEGEWERAALPSLMLIIFSLVPTILLFWQSELNE